MKLYSFCTPSHTKIKEEWFLPSMKDDFDLILEEHTQLSKTGCYMADGWRETMYLKVELIIRAINENPDTVFIHSDVDVQFFKPVKETIMRLIKGKDMVIQQESELGAICPGFFAARGNEKNLKLWQDIRQELESQENKHDQHLLNEKLIETSRWFLKKLANRFTRDNRSWLPNHYDINWGYLPDTFFGPGIVALENWNPGDHLLIPKDIVLHHANRTVGIGNKIAQLNYVRDIVQNRNTD